MTARHRLLAASLAMTVGAALTACSSGGSETPAEHGRATIDMWGWDQGLDTAVKAFNDSQTRITVNYTKITSGAADTNLHNSVAAGNPPCLLQSAVDKVTPFVAEGILTDVGADLEKHASKYRAGVLDTARVAGSLYAVPTGANPTFYLYNKQALEARGITSFPKTYAELLDVGRKLNAVDGTKIVNLAGEDPSTFVSLASQAGAAWYTIDDDRWVVEFDSPATRKAGELVQALVDEDLVTKNSYTDYQSVMQGFDKGKVVAGETSTWQLQGRQKNFVGTQGQWALSPVPQFESGKDVTGAGAGQAMLVPKGCANPAAAVEAAVWLGTDPSAVSMLANPTTGASRFPVSGEVTEAIEMVLPKSLLGANAESGAKVIEQSVGKAAPWTYGPNYAAAYEELADQWGKVVARTGTMNALIEHMQKWIVDDLKKRGINVVED